MSYQVLARKWRPRNFATLVGQEHVVRALINALEQQRLHHAYLFTGTRGVGKTTVARILAKCLNCERGISANPCSECNACQEIDSGRFVDLIEVDAASRTKVEDTRELLDNVQYAPSKGRFKVYLIDEVHMLSGHSFNALLKTLEEPPPHVKFLLATTDPQKLPMTILSRCLQFHLKNLAPERIANYLTQVLQAENISYENTATELLAIAANGSMRDALSLLDQGIAYGNGKIILSDIQAMLGTIEKTHLYDLLALLANQQGEKILALIQQLAEQGTDFTQALEELLTLLHHIAVAQVLPQNKSELTQDAQRIATLAKTFSAEEIQLYYQIALLGRRDLVFVPNPKNGFEMIVLRMLAFRPQELSQTNSNTSQSSSKSTPLAASPTANNKKPDIASAAQTSWNELLEKLNLSGPTRALAAHCALTKLTETEAVLTLDPSQTPLLNDKAKQRMADAFSNYFQRPMQITLTVAVPTVATPAGIQQQKQVERQATATQKIQQDHNVQAILDVFSAKIVPNSIQAVEKE